jgi:small nuclear ribonucleoprotein (snRNP)-like protein
VRDQIEGGYARLQRDTEGQIVGTLTKFDGQMRLTLEDGFMLVKHPNTGRLLVWDKKKQRIVEFAK